jgi:hypothetical protein
VKQQVGWVCRCDCGRQVTRPSYELRNGRMPSCGCVKVYGGATHRMSRSPEHRTWCGMIQRCTNPERERYNRYGGRGIRVCDEWRGPNGFASFYAHVGPRPSSKHSIDRYPDNDGDYCPGNVRWATMLEQQHGRSSLILVSFDGRTMPLGRWIRELGLPQRNTYLRVEKGMSPLMALGLDVSCQSTTPRRRPE